MFVGFVLVLFVAPPVGAEWMLSGSYEPDTPSDRAHARMWLDPDASPDGWRLYFGVVPTDRDPASQTNPNAALLRSRILPAGQMGMQAWLGVWKDCNRDGYVGLLETAVHEYKTELLVDRSVCPIGSIFHHHGWVSEFVHVGPGTLPPTSAMWPRFLPDADARVWGDFGRPGVIGEIRYDCFQYPLPRGTMDSTGGVLRYADCQVQHRVAKSLVEVDALFGTDLAFDGEGGLYRPDRDCDHPLNVQLRTYGNSACDERPGVLDGNASSPMFTAWDCANRPSGYLVDVRDPTAPPGQTGQLSRVAIAQVNKEVWLTSEDGTYGLRPMEGSPHGGIYARVADPIKPKPQLVDPHGSAYSGAQHAVDRFCFGRHDDSGPGEEILGEGDITSDPSSGKRVADVPFRFAPPCCLSFIHQGYPQNAGLRVASRGPWESNFTYHPPAYMGGTIRTDSLRPAGAVWFTFYASVGPVTLQRGIELPQAGVAVYGAEACGENDSGVHAGWNCDPQAWPDRHLRVHATYQLRDTDCYDGLVLEHSGVHASLAALSDDPPCPLPDESRHSPAMAGRYIERRGDWRG